MALFSASAYLKANPDVADYYYNNRDQVGGMDLNQWAKKHWDTYGQNEGRSRGSFTKGEAGAASRNEYMLGGSQQAYDRARQNNTTDYTVTKEGNLISWSPSTGTVVHNNVPQGYIDYVNEYNRANEESSLARGWDLENDGFDPTPVPGLGSPIGQGGGNIGSGVGGNLGGGVGDIGIGGVGTGNPYFGPSDPTKWLYPVPGQPRSPAGFGFNPYSQNTSSLWQNTVYTPWGFGGTTEQPAGEQAPAPQPQPQSQPDSIWDPLSGWKNKIGTALGLPPDFGANSFGGTAEQPSNIGNHLPGWKNRTGSPPDFGANSSGNVWDPLATWKNSIGTALGVPPDFGINSFGNTQQNMARDPFSLWRGDAGANSGVPLDNFLRSLGNQNVQQNMARGGAVRRQGALSALANKAFRR